MQGDYAMSNMRKINTGVVSFGTHSRSAVVSLVQTALASERREVEPAVKSHPVPQVGDTVVLNDFGLEQLFGTKLGLGHMKTKRLTITHVGRQSLTEPELTFDIAVDDPEINSYLIDHWCVDIVAKGLR
jgi:hypothetical protein